MLGFYLHNIKNDIYCLYIIRGYQCSKVYLLLVILSLFVLFHITYIVKSPNLEPGSIKTRGNIHGINLIQVDKNL